MCYRQDAGEGARATQKSGVGAMPREIVTMQCGDCKERNYSTTKNRKTTTERLEFKKFCRRCRKHTPHKEVK
jgi:large subunit ribosomal protein L33